jgi:hypothetical protein
VVTIKEIHREISGSRIGDYEDYSLLGQPIAPCTLAEVERRFGVRTPIIRVRSTNEFI